MGLTNTAYLLLLLKGGAPACIYLLMEMEERTRLGGFTAQPGPFLHLHKQIDKYHFEAVLQLVNSKLLFVSALMYVLRGFLMEGLFSAVCAASPAGLSAEALEYWVALNRVLGIGPVKFRLLLTFFPD